MKKYFSMVISTVLLFFLGCFTHSSALAQSQNDSAKALCRYPTLYGNTIVFEAGGNLWRVDRNGGTASRLTTDKGFDIMPRFSPDGKTIAFTGDYDGNTDVYTMPADGGPVTRLTFHSDVVNGAPLRWGPDNMVVSWTPDGKNIVFLSRRNTFNTWFGRLFSVPVEGGLPEQLPLPKGGLLSYNRDGSKIAYNRIFRNFRTWKDYYGGLAQDIWIYDFNTKKIERITDWKGTDTYPMWYNNKIYFASDRDSSGRLNIWSYDLQTKEFKQITHFKDYDIDWPSLGNDGIAFQCGGSLYVLDLPSETLHKINVTVPNDDTQLRPRWVDASKDIGSFDIAPNGKRALFDARGDIFTVPEEHGNTRDLTQTSDAREQYPAWSPDGKWIAYTTDITGESEVAIRPSDGSGKEEILTKSKNKYFYGPTWSPGSDKLVFSDNNKTLWYFNIKDKKLVRVDSSIWNEIHDYSWSPDGLWLAYSKSSQNNFGSIYLYNLKDDMITDISTGMDNDGSPAFSADGKYLYFVSARNENPLSSQIEFNFATTKMNGIYVTTLRKDEESPFAPQSDEGSTEAKKDTAKKSSEEKEKSGALKPIKIDLDGLMSRAVPLPIPSGNIYGLLTAGDMIYYVTYPSTVVDGPPVPGKKPVLYVFDMKKRKNSELVSSVSSYALSADGSKILYVQGGKYIIADAKPGGSKEDEKTLDLSEMKMEVNPVKEWNEMFHQAWRLEHEFFYNKDMNGKNWDEIGAKYAKLLPELSCREDLNYVIGEMIGELQNSHCYVGGGDEPENASNPTGLLGVDFALDKASGRYYFKKIYPGDNTRDDYRSPLTEPGVDAKDGDFLLAVDGHELKAPTNPYGLFINTLGKTVALTLADNADGKNKHDVTVKPISNELNLRLKDWIDHNREVVNKESDGKIGYIYLTDMEELGLDQFIRQFYPQIRKDGLIIDERYNEGGNVDQIILERLRRVLIGMETNRQGAPGTTPGEVFHGYMAALMNHYSASDGDIFPYYFKKYKLGPVIGERSWGGVRGIRGYWNLLDGGYITISEFSIYGLSSEWVVENHGVEPDIEVDNLPGDVMSGKDAQLDEAVKYLMKKIKDNPPKIPQRPPLLPAYPPNNGE
jgi:tricorn protease